MHIAHVTATFPPHHTGTGIVCFYNALGLAQAGQRVTVLTADDAPPGHSDPEEIAVRRLPALFRFGNAPLLTGLGHLDDYDIVHLHYPFYFGAETVYGRSLLGGPPYVVTYHQDVLFTGWLRMPERFHHYLIGRRIVRRAARVLATSLDYAQASRLQEFLHDTNTPLAELPNGVDASRFHPDINPAHLRARYGLEPTDRVILFVGALDRAHYFKGVDNLLSALAQISLKPVRLLVVGEGSLRRTYQQQATDLGLARQVIFCGRISDDELPAHYALSDLLVLPSTTMGEAFGVVLLEAFACGKPVVASHLPGVRSVVSDGYDGYLVQPGDVKDLAEKTETLLGDAQRCQEFGARGRMKVETTYDWPAIIPRLERVYEEVLSGAARSG
jgi:glycosyltransferase involved in cell wall biosynthesis